MLRVLLALRGTLHRGQFLYLLRPVPKHDVTVKHSPRVLLVNDLGFDELINELLHDDSFLARGNRQGQGAKRVICRRRLRCTGELPTSSDSMISFGIPYGK